MGRFFEEPTFVHGNQAAQSQVGIVLLNLGTPDAPTPSALRVYLKEFLSDTRVIEIPPAVWQIILRGFILPFRPKKSAAKYASIWTEKGSPLLLWTLAQSQALQQALSAAGHQVEVAYAMRYGNPSVPSVLDDMRQRCKKLLIVPLYPQYAGSSSATAIDSVMSYCLRVRNVPELRFVRSFHDHAGYIAALAENVRRHWQLNGRAERLVMSFHGVPLRTLQLGDPYHCECLKTGRLLAEALGLSADQYLVTFQSRFGRAKWLEPYTEPTVRRLASEGVKSLDVICPGFVSDCLETLEEIAMEVKEAFLEEGGQVYHYIPALNTEPLWIESLKALCIQHLQGWETQSSYFMEHAAHLQEQAQAQAKRARALGAS